MSRLWKRIKSGISEVVQSRIFVVIVLFCVLAAILVQRVFYLQIVKGQSYFDDYKLQIQKTKEVQGTRGNIYDRNGNLLAYNELAYSVTIEDSGDYDTIKQKNKEINKVISTVIDIVESNGDSIINSFGIILDSNNEYKFASENKTQRLRFIADVYGKQTIDELSKKQSNISADGLIKYLCTDDLYGYGLDQKKLDKTQILKMINIRYALSLNSYQKYITTTIAEDVSDDTVADIMENLDTLPGVNIEEESLRRYNDSYCFANLIGYTGQISQDEYDALSKEEQKEYSKTDTVGKSGLEQILDKQLQGKKGDVKLYVDSVGKVIDTVKGDDPEAGNDLYLTIDANLQKVAYHVIEQELAGVLLTKIQDTLDYDRNSVDDSSEIRIPIGDVYDSFIENNLLDTSHFYEDDAKTAEKEVGQTFSKRKENVINNVIATLQDSKSAAYKDQTKEMQAYLNYIVSDFLTNTQGVLMSDAIDTSDSTYKAWTDDESISAYKYLTYAISQNWVDTSLLKDYVSSEGTYSDSNETYQAMIAYLKDEISGDQEFDKLIYRYMIKSGEITGRQVCMMLYEQGILKQDDEQYNNLNSGKTDAYSFMISKIQSLEITPGQLGLEPCTGSFVMTDPTSGEVLACVSYPGYDNNRLANTMDSDYYNQLVTDSSRPFYNNATQEKTAPGSTYKPLTAIAGLTEGIIDTNTVIDCNGIYDKVEPNPKCWIYPDGHGSLDVIGAITNSCNIFFYEVGWEMSQEKVESKDENGNTVKTTDYSSEKGLEILKKYAEEFGFGDKSGLEIPESEPQISDDSSVPSAIGQGTNNYTVSQLARYATALANRGTVYNLSLLDKVTTVDGKVVKDYSPEVKNEVKGVSASTWNAVQEGMRGVVTVADATAFPKINASDVEVYGKTGTAQESTTHPDHALFIGFANENNQNPVAFATRIANGYTSLYTCQIGNDILEYYYQITDEKKIVTGKASSVSTSSGAHD